jgi:hypothetical protein
LGCFLRRKKKKKKMMMTNYRYVKECTEEVDVKPMHPRHPHEMEVGG